MTPQLKLVKDLTVIYIRWHVSKYAISSIDYLRDALVEAQRQLSSNEKVLYEKWHKKKWPNLIW